MTDIQAIYIIDKEGTLLYTYIPEGQEHQESQETPDNLLSGFINTFQSLALEFGDEEMKEAKIGEASYFFTKDKLSGISIVIMSELESKLKRIHPLLVKIKNLFITTFFGNVYNEEAKKYLFESFEISLEKLLKESSDEKVLDFFKGL